MVEEEMSRVDRKEDVRSLVGSYQHIKFGLHSRIS